MSKGRTYNRPAASTGMKPKGYKPFALSESLGHSVLRRLRPYAGTLNDVQVRARVERAVDRYKISFHPSRQKAGLPPAKKQRECAAKIANRARALLLALRTADSETIKRMAQQMAFGGDKAERAKMREELTGLIPAEIELLMDAAEYGVRRADQHAGGGRHGSPLQALVVDLARIWKDETGREFPGSRKETNHAAQSVRAAARSYVDLVLFDIAGLSREAVPKKRLDWLLTYARAVVSPGADQLSAFSAQSSSDRFWDAASADQ